MTFVLSHCTSPPGQRTANDIDQVKHQGIQDGAKPTTFALSVQTYFIQQACSESLVSHPKRIQ